VKLKPATVGLRDIVDRGGRVGVKLAAFMDPVRLVVEGQEFPDAAVHETQIEFLVVRGRVQEPVIVIQVVVGDLVL